MIATNLAIPSRIFPFFVLVSARKKNKKLTIKEFIAFRKSFCFSLIPFEENFRSPFYGESSSSNTFLRVKSFFLEKHMASTFV